MVFVRSMSTPVTSPQASPAGSVPQSETRRYADAGGVEAGWPERTAAVAMAAAAVVKVVRATGTALSLLLLVRRARPVAEFLRAELRLVIFVGQVDEVDVRDGHLVDRPFTAADPVARIRVVLVGRRVVVNARLVQHRARREHWRVL